MSDFTKLQSAEPVLVTDGTTSAAISTSVAGSEAGLVVREATKGQTTMASSKPVAIASDQSNLNITNGTVAVTSGTITSAASAVTATSLAPYSGAVVSISGTYAGVNATFEVSDDTGTTWYSISATRVDDSGCDGATTGVLTANTSRMWWVYWGVTTQFRVRATAWTSGTATVKITPSAGVEDPSMYVEGKVASGTTDTANPLKIGGRSASAVVTPVSDGQRVSGMFDRSGRFVTTGSDRLLVVKGSISVANTTETTVIAAQGAGVFCDITSIFIANLAASATTNVTIRDVTAGTAVLVIPVVGAGQGIQLNFNPPIPQTTANSAWTMQSSAAITNGMKVFMMGIKTQ